MTPAMLIVLGFGGHARSVADVALAAGIRALVFVDAGARPGEAFAGFPAVTALPQAPEEPWRVFPAAGDNLARARQFETFGAPQHFFTLISPRAYIGVGATIGQAVLVAHHAHVGPAASVADGCIINTGAVVEHECEIGRFTHVSVNATVAGRCRIGKRVFLGAGSIVADGVTIGDDVIVGAGAVVVDDLREAGTYVGAPARPLRH